MPKKYEVGYRKPPKHSQFKTGQSGNPKGKPKGSRNFSTDAKKVLKQPTRVTQGGKSKIVSTQHAALLRMREKALGGDARALDRMLDIASKHNNEEFAEEAEKLSLSDQEILAAYEEEILQKAAKSQPDDDAEATNGTGKGTSKSNKNDNTQEDDDDDSWLN